MQKTIVKIVATVLVVFIILIGCSHPKTKSTLTLEGFIEGINEISKFEDSTLLKSTATIPQIPRLYPAAKIFVSYRLDTKTPTVDYVDIITPSQEVALSNVIAFNEKKGIAKCFSYDIETKGKSPSHYYLQICYAPEVSHIHPIAPMASYGPEHLPLTDEMKKFIEKHPDRKLSSGGQVWIGEGVVVLLECTSFGNGGDEIQTESIRFCKKLLKYVFDVFSKQKKSTN